MCFAHAGSATQTSNPRIHRRPMATGRGWCAGCVDSDLCPTHRRAGAVPEVRPFRTRRPCTESGRGLRALAGRQHGRPRRLSGQTREDSVRSAGAIAFRRAARRACYRATVVGCHHGTWSVRRPCRTRCEQPGSTGSCASPGCFPTSGPCATSTRSSNSHAGSASPPTAETPPTSPPRSSRTSSTPSPPGDAIVPIHRTYRLDDIAAARADMEAGRATVKLVVLP